MTDKSSGGADIAMKVMHLGKESSVFLKMRNIDL